VGHPRFVHTPELREAFRRDWALGIPIAEMAALYGFRNVNSVTRKARRLGLPPRAGGPERGGAYALTGGRWVSNGRVQVWVEDEAS